MNELPVALQDKLRTVYERAYNVEKNGYNKAQDYHYATVDDVKAAVNVAFRAAGLFVSSSTFDLLSQTPFTKNSDGTRTPGRAVLKLTLTVTDGTHSMKFEGLGEALDSGDKAIYKAMAGAIKYALTVGLLIATGDRDDPENDAPGDEKKMTAATSRTAPKTVVEAVSTAQQCAAAIDEIAAMATLTDLTSLKIRLNPLYQKVSKDEWKSVVDAFKAREAVLAESATKEQS